MKALIDAQQQAIKIINEALSGVDTKTMEDELKAKSKKELIAMLMDKNVCYERSRMLKQKVSIEDISYNILCDPLCVWLTYDAIAALIKKMIPNAETSAKSLSWYASKQTEKGRDVLPRAKIKDLTKLMMNL